MATKNDEFWLDLVNRGLIIVDPTQGKIFSCYRGKIRQIGYTATNGYTRCGILRDKKQVRILAHRLIWFAAKGDIPDGYEPNHINGIHDDNRIENLELLTHKKNMEHAKVSLGKVFGFHPGFGLESYNHKLSFELADKIRSEYSAGNITQRALAKKFGVVQATIWNVLKEKQWVYS